MDERGLGSSDVNFRNLLSNAMKYTQEGEKFSFCKKGAFPKPEKLDRLLPWSNELPKELRTKIKSKK